MSDFNILFTSAGRRVSLVRCFRDALNGLGIAGKLVTADLTSDAPSHSVSDIQEMVPAVDDDQYIVALQQICGRHAISLVIPLIDTELPVLAKYAAYFQKKGSRVLISSPETCDLCLDKRSTARFFNKTGVATPKLYTMEEAFSDPGVSYPVIVKPADGSSSLGVSLVKNNAELQFFSRYVANSMIQEYIPGEEYTLDILLDFEGRVQCVIPRLRIETRAGEISKGRTVKNRALMTAGKKVAEALPNALGCITVQCFLTAEQQIIFTEINPRFGGGFPLSAAAGANFPKWIIEMALNRTSSAAFDAWEDGLTMLRYDEAFFIRNKQPSRKEDPASKP